MKYERTVVKRLFKMGRSVAENEYRNYLIARNEFYNRSGIFTIDELLNTFPDKYGVKSMNHKSNRDKYNKKYSQLFRKSFFFEELNDGRFKIRSQRKLWES